MISNDSMLADGWYGELEVKIEIEETNGAQSAFLDNAIKRSIYETVEGR